MLICQRPWPSGRRVDGTAKPPVAHADPLVTPLMLKLLQLQPPPGTRRRVPRQPHTPEFLRHIAIDADGLRTAYYRDIGRIQT